MGKSLNTLKKILSENYNLDISAYDESHLQKTLENRLLAGGYSSPDQYFNSMGADHHEADALIKLLDNSYSEFFRNQIAFYFLEQKILPQIFDKKSSLAAPEIRIWSTACARGEEAYSIAILTHELLLDKKKNMTCRLFGTDKNPENLVFARKGTYKPSSLDHVTLKRINTYFTRKGDDYTIRPQFRDCIDFSEFDLLDEQAFCPSASVYGNFDIVFCSNILYYYQPRYRKFMLMKISRSLARDAVIVTDLAERSILKEFGFCELYECSGIFQKTRSE